MRAMIAFAALLIVTMAVEQITDEDRIHEISSDEASDAIDRSGQADRISDHEDRIGDLESRLGM